MDSVSQSRDPRSTVMVGVPRGPRDSVALAGGKKDENKGGENARLFGCFVGGKICTP